MGRDLFAPTRRIFIRLGAVFLVDVEKSDLYLVLSIYSGCSNFAVAFDEPHFNSTDPQTPILRGELGEDARTGWDASATVLRKLRRRIPRFYQDIRNLVAAALKLGSGLFPFVRPPLTLRRSHAFFARQR